MNYLKNLVKKFFFVGICIKTVCFPKEKLSPTKISIHKLGFVSVWLMLLKQFEENILELLTPLLLKVYKYQSWKKSL